ncbi:MULTISPECIES: DUF6457 domain-containing protein [unclassified Arthrobacter]|uniref:DUF6457 domain-containing protein n=1 Tax=unclassified Arthrobacter TaxID=235627 RepID=UPI001D15A82A|nr:MULTISPECIES: DUF6457 domain-containing protein [unclassified Arthrobacter]MCC3277297.1 DUF6457 domain-containing protein [Arthrobacter sp. zg-Y20]MCC3280238.1 DUF6457 domain-containing protein [Arthrobacter sp. zg-Y40]MCC9178958.1 DUF6457 domain-containing protein [Arthrobacter sp. zg-Y750]MDK1317457.1 DUF6457 domain-containing protein [Arthrobacter sp. zg.Y20]MDK1328409.1 DUF6457 domain-containing protein [Arthrobacter sp. zg-Y1143]
MSTNPETEERRLDDWSRRLTQALQILDLEVDTPMLLELGRKSEETVGGGADIISGFVVGYAAGLTKTSGRKSAEAAVQKAADTAFQLAETGLEGPDNPGWKGSAQ